MRSKNHVSLVGMVVVVVFVVSNFGCGGGTSSTPTPTPPPAISVSVSAGTTTVQAGATTQLTATVTNDPTNKGVSWTVTCSTAPCGTVSPAATASGVATTYTAPANPPSGGMAVTITATSVSNTSASAFATVTLAGNNVQALTITTTSLSNGTVNVPYSTTLQSSGGTPPVTWSVATGTALPPGLSLSSDGTISGTPSAPGSAGFGVLATDSTKPTPQDAYQDFSIGINAADTSHNAFLNGHYAFLMSGFTHLSGIPAPALNASAGSFVADGHGNLTSGVSDTDTTGGVTADQPFTGTYALGSDNRGTMSMNYSWGTVTLAFSVGSMSPSGVATKGRIINFATGDVPTAGEFDLQATTGFSNSAISGSYAFGFSGWSAIQEQFGADGVFTTDGAGNIPNGTTDENITGTFTSNDSLTGTYNVAAGSTTGRGTASLSIAGTTLNVAFYVVSASKLLIVSAEQAINPLVFIGQALRQSGGPFSNNSLSGTSVFSAEATGRIHEVAGGLATFDGTSTVTLLQDQNEAGTITLSGTTSETYSVSSNGRGTETAEGSIVSVLYLVSAGEGFILNTDPNAAVGFFEPQSAGPFTDSSINGSFFFGNLPPSYYAEVSSGVATLNAGTINQTSDINQPVYGAAGGSGPIYDQTSMDTYTVSSDGRVTTGSGNEVIYIVSPTKFVVIDVSPGDLAPSIKVAEQ